MSDDDLNLDDVLKEALQNAREDRKIACDTFTKMKAGLDLEDEDNLNKTMLAGEKAIKVLEQASRANEQIIKAAQILEKRESKKKVEKNKPFDLSELLDQPPERENAPKLKD